MILPLPLCKIHLTPIILKQYNSNIFKAAGDENIKNLIYLSKINPELPQDKFNALLQNISKENRERCQRFRFKEDALRTLYGELMVRYVLGCRFSLKNEDIEFSRNAARKPFIKDCPIHFNISHAGDFVVCAFSEQEIGIDIEKIKDIDLDIAQRFFHQQEYDDLLAQQKPAQLDYFYSLWTLKESYLKWLGTGLSTPLDSFCFNIADMKITCVDKNRKETPFFKQFYVEGYKLSVCSMVNDFPDKVEDISIEKMVF